MYQKTSLNAEETPSEPLEQNKCCIIKKKSVGKRILYLFSGFGAKKWIDYQELSSQGYLDQIIQFQRKTNKKPKDPCDCSVDKIQNISLRAGAEIEILKNKYCKQTIDQKGLGKQENQQHSGIKSLELIDVISEDNQESVILFQVTLIGGKLEYLTNRQLKKLSPQLLLSFYEKHIVKI